MKNELLALLRHERRINQVDDTVAHESVLVLQSEDLHDARRVVENRSFLVVLDLGKAGLPGT